jgi:exoribonuclease-2
MRKSEAALVLGRQIGRVFDAVVTGVAKGNRWVRTFEPPAEGLLRGGLDVRVGQKLRVRLVSTDVERGFIDFEVA